MRTQANDYAARWAVIGGLALVGAAWLAAMGVAFDWDAASRRVVELAKFGLVLAGFAAVGRMAPALGSGLSRGYDLGLSVIQLYVLVMVFLPISYACASAGAAFPLLDGTLAGLDMALFGFDWDTAAQWVATRPWLE